LRVKSIIFFPKKKKKNEPRNSGYQCFPGPEGP
jgi:hypothetical protein